MKQLPVIGERCPACEGWISRRCPCGGRPDATTTLERLARDRTAVDRATRPREASTFKAPPRRPA
jgi:hypothetical protein